MSSLAVRRGLELWFGGLFTAAELAAADLLLQLRVGGGGETAASSSATTTTTSSPRLVSTCCEDVTVEDEEEQVEGTGPALGTMELDDRRARKRYRLLSELYAATSPVRKAAAAKKRKRDDDQSESSEAMRYGDY